MYEKGFNRAGFMTYLASTFNGFENCFLRETIENIIEYAQKWEHVSKDQFCFFIADMIAEITFSEVAMFCDDSILTAWGQEQKRGKTHGQNNIIK